LIRSQFGLQTTKTTGFSDSTRNPLSSGRAGSKFRARRRAAFAGVHAPNRGRHWLLDKDRYRSPNHGLDTRLDTGHAVTTAARLDGTNSQPDLRHPVVAALRCIPIRIPLPSTSTTELHPGPACCLATRSDRPTPALAPRMPDRRWMAIARSIIGLRLYGVLVEPVRNPLFPDLSNTLGWSTGKPDSTCFVCPQGIGCPCHPVAAMGFRDESTPIDQPALVLTDTCMAGPYRTGSGAPEPSHLPGHMAWCTAFGLAPGSRTSVVHSY
jgi:hypothetical protein